MISPCSPWPLLSPRSGRPPTVAGRGPSARRSSVRREVVLPCQAVRERDFVLVADRTLDVSIDGLLLPLQRHVLTGESLILSFPIPGTWIDVEATVARVIHGRRPGDDGLSVGVVFDRLAPSSRAALAAFLHGRREPAPRRGPVTRPVDGLGVLRAVVDAWQALATSGDPLHA